MTRVELGWRYVRTQAGGEEMETTLHGIDVDGIIEDLRALRCDALSSHENLSIIARCVYDPEFGWTHGACESLRTRLLCLLEAARDGMAATDFAKRVEEAAEAEEGVTLFDVDYMACPGDMDGNPVHVGDMVSFEDGEGFMVCGIGDETLYYPVDDGEGGHVEWTQASSVRRCDQTEDARDVISDLAAEVRWVMERTEDRRGERDHEIARIVDQYLDVLTLREPE